MSVKVRLENRYFVLKPRSVVPLEWNPADIDDLPIPDCAYIGRVLTAMEKSIPERHLTIYVTYNLDTLPTYGNDVVAFVLGDEWCRVPRYVFKVRAVFKTYGTQPTVNWRALTRPTLYEIAALVQDVRNIAFTLPYIAHALLSYTRLALRGYKPKWPVYDFPLGYYQQTPVPYVTISKRHHDVYFAGSLTNSRTASMSQRITPKALSRRHMLRELTRLMQKHKDISINTALTSAFGQDNSELNVQYSHALMQAQICMVPRGTSLETYRYFEGLRAGCVLVTERLPRRWFYTDSPAIRVRNWIELRTIIPDLLADTSRLELLSAASHAWWSERCSESAVGEYVAARVK